MSQPRVAVPAHDRVVERAVPRRHGQLGVGGQLDVAQALGDAHVVGVDHAGHALAHRAQVVELGVDERPWVERAPGRAAGTVPGMTQLRVRLRRRGTARRTPLRPASSSRAGGTTYHHSARSDSTFQASRMVANGSMHWRSGGASSSRLIHAQPPHTSQRTGREVDVAGLQIVLGERPRLRDEGVGAVGAVAPAVERADEPVSHVPRPSATLHAAVAAGVLEAPVTPMSSVRTTMIDWSRIWYSAKSSGSRDLLEPARHLPDPRPEQLGLQLVEVRVVVALLGDPVRGAPSAKGTGRADHFWSTIAIVAPFPLRRADSTVY